MITFNTTQRSNINNIQTAKKALPKKIKLAQDSVSFSGTKLKAADFDPTREVGKYGIKAMIAKITRFTGTLKNGNFEAEFQKGTKVGEKRFRCDGTLSVSRKFDNSGQLSEITTHRRSGKHEETLEYDGIGHLTSETEHSTTGWKRVTGFDEEGRKIGKTTYDKNGKVFSIDFYDSQGKIATTNNYFESGKLKNSSQWENGEIISTVHRREDSSIEGKVERNADGGTTSYEYRPDETLEMKIVYNANGRLKCFTPHDESGRPLETKLAQ